MSGPIKPWTGWAWSAQDSLDYTYWLEKKEGDVKLYVGKKYKIVKAEDMRPGQKGVFSNYGESLGNIAAKFDAVEAKDPKKDGGTAYGHTWLAKEDSRHYRYAIVRVEEEINEFGPVVP